MPPSADRRDARARGVAAHIEHEPAVGDYWRATASRPASRPLAGLRERSRLATALVAGAAAALVADDVDGGRHVLRGVLPRRTPRTCSPGPGTPPASGPSCSSPTTMRRTGLLFHPGLARQSTRSRRGCTSVRSTSTQTGRLMVAGPRSSPSVRSRAAFVAALRRALERGHGSTDARRRALGGGAGRKRQPLRGRRPARARRRARREPPHGVRVLLLRRKRGVVHGGDARLRRAPRAAPSIPRAPSLSRSSASDRRTWRSSRAKACCASVTTTAAFVTRSSGRPTGAGSMSGADCGSAPGRPMRLPALLAGYRAACLAAVTDLKTPANYHWPSDVAETSTGGRSTRPRRCCAA